MKEYLILDINNLINRVIPLAFDVNGNLALCVDSDGDIYASQELCKHLIHLTPFLFAIEADKINEKELLELMIILRKL